MHTLRHIRSQLFEICNPVQRRNILLQVFFQPIETHTKGSKVLPKRVMQISRDSLALTFLSSNYVQKVGILGLDYRILN